MNNTLSALALLTLTLWRDARKNPPADDDGVAYATDEGFAEYVASEGPDGGISGAAWYVPGAGDYLDPQPTVWSDPLPPRMSDPLTVDDLRRICDLARVGNAEVWAKSGHPHTDQFKTEDTQTIDRLRSALAAFD